MKNVVITGTGLFTPEHSISNEELVTAFNQYVENYNKEYADEISSGALEPLQPSSCEFIEKASGIKSRHAINKEGIIDPQRMCPKIPERDNESNSLQCEMAIAAANEAMAQAGKTVEDIDIVICAASNMQRAYPAMAIEIQAALGIDGYAYDMNVACSSATFGIQNAASVVESGNAKCVLMINPEITTGHLNFRDRDSHFIFGDACTAVIVENRDNISTTESFEVLGTKLKTVFSSNIRNNFGFLNRCDEQFADAADKLFIQEGRKVFKEVSPMVAELIAEHLAEHQIPTLLLKRLWLHQANANMNNLIAKRLLGHEPTPEFAPTVLDTYANTSSAGSIIAFHKCREGILPGDVGIICSFGAGYSVGNVIVRKC